MLTITSILDPIPWEEAMGDHEEFMALDHEDHSTETALLLLALESNPDEDCIRQCWKEIRTSVRHCRQPRCRRNWSDYQQVIRERHLWD